MLNLVLALLVTVLLAALLALNGMTMVVVWMAKIIFGLFLALFLVSLVHGRRRV